MRYDGGGPALFRNRIFAKPENRLRYYAAAEKFLAKHLGGRFES